jgi:acetyltransferase-like isoleucine patch superfamily enzyme
VNAPTTSNTGSDRTGAKIRSIVRWYGLIGSSKLMKSLLFTKAFYPEARLIRLPFDIRNRRLISLGRNLTTGVGCRIEAHPMDGVERCIEIGDDVEINDYVHIVGTRGVHIGNHVLIASKVFISDLNHGSYGRSVHDSPTVPPKNRSLSARPVVIEDNVWIGESVCVMPGVTIGFGSVIGAGSIVTRSIPAQSIAVGAPARVVKTFDTLTSQWVPVATHSHVRPVVS